jgi:tetratricopeptide (TPR) repeat protein
VALIDLASANSGGQREALLRQACAKFEAIVRIKPDEYRALSNWGAALVSLALARTEAGREAVLREACQKFEATVTVKPNEYRALNNWGVALLFLARTTSGVEKRSLLLEAAAKVAEARCCAASMGDEAACREYAANICSIVLSLCAYLVEAGDVASAAERFRQALSLLGQVESQISRRALAALFRGAAKESTADLCAQFFQDMRDKGLNDELAFLDPFVKAVEYWQKGKDAEVLDRLNPEVRKLVEEIVGARPK